MSTDPTTSIIKWLKFIQLFLLPGVCVLCRRNTGTEQDLCQACAQRLETIPRPCRACGSPLPESSCPSRYCGPCLLGARSLTRSVVPYAWREPVSDLIGGFKYHGRLQYGAVLTEQLQEAITAAYSGDPLPDLLVPIPLHRRRLAWRGYNQAALMTRQLGKALSVPVSCSLLQRVRNTPPQQGQSARQRRRNLHGAFRIDAKRLERLPAVGTIAIVDDVVTTLTTANTVARLLQGSIPGRPHIHLWALARA